MTFVISNFRPIFRVLLRILASESGSRQICAILLDSTIPRGALCGNDLWGPGDATRDGPDGECPLWTIRPRSRLTITVDPVYCIAMHKPDLTRQSGRFRRPLCASTRLHPCRYASDPTIPAYRPVALFLTIALVLGALLACQLPAPVVPTAGATPSGAPPASATARPTILAPTAPAPSAEPTEGADERTCPCCEGERRAVSGCVRGAARRSLPYPLPATPTPTASATAALTATPGPSPTRTTRPTNTPIPWPEPLDQPARASSVCTCSGTMPRHHGVHPPQPAGGGQGGRRPGLYVRGQGVSPTTVTVARFSADEQNTEGDPVEPARAFVATTWRPYRWPPGGGLLGGL